MINYSFHNLFIYYAIAIYTVAFLSFAMGKMKTARVVFLIGFIFAAYIFLWRWHKINHIPLQNMFDIFLFMAMFVYPISIFCRLRLFIKEEIVDCLLGIIFLFAAGFIFSPRLQMLPPALQSWLFAPHVIFYLISYILMIKAAVQAVCQLARQKNLQDAVRYENSTYSLICLGFPFLTFGLLSGSWWGKIAWGDYWGWDPKELWSLVSWLVYAEYFHFRYMFGSKKSWICSCFAILGVIMIFLTLLWVNLSKIFPGLHNYAG